MHRKRQRTTSACQRCKSRKIGCDHSRPCLLCVRAGVECVPGRDSRDQTSVNTTRGSANITSDTIYDKRPAILPESNIIDLSKTIFSTILSDQTIRDETFALPAGVKEGTSTGQATHKRHWRYVVVVEAPPDGTLGELVDQFFMSVDWFMMVFHEQSFRGDFSQLIASETVTTHQETRLWLYMLVAALGAHYEARAGRVSEDTQSLKQFSSNIICQIEFRFLSLMGCTTLETVQICILLGSFFIFNGRPNVGLAISGSGIKMAQVLGLHRESLWPEMSASIRESRRRTWWALGVFDKYAAIAFGRPSVIDDSDCSVGAISKVDPAENSPLLLYHQWKVRLYSIMSSFLTRRRLADGQDDVDMLHQQLVSWKEELPSRLRLPPPLEEPETPSLLQVQALALHLTYDNLQIILHRSAAFGTAWKANSNTSDIPSYRHLRDAAMRTASLHQYPHILKICRQTHANMHIGITLFTAGVVLCAIALSQPLTSASSDAKRGVTDIIRVCQDPASSQHLVSMQSISVLKRLISAVLKQEEQIMTGQASDIHGSGPTGFDGHALDLTQQSDALPEGRSTAIDEPLVEPTMRETINDPNPIAQWSSDPTNGFDWSINPASLVEMGLEDASQLWLWADISDSPDGNHGVSGSDRYI